MGREGRRCRTRRANLANRSSNEYIQLPNQTRALSTVTFALSTPATANMDKEKAEKSAYEVVGVGSDATDADIKKAFRQRSLKTHPDRVRYPTSRS